MFTKQSLIAVALLSVLADASQIKSPNSVPQPRLLKQQPESVLLEPTKLLFWLTSPTTSEDTYSQELASLLSNQKDQTGRSLYEVTAVVWRDSVFLKEQENLKLYRLEAPTPPNLDSFAAQELQLLNQEGLPQLKQLRAKDFDLGLVDNEYTQAKLMDYLDLPFLQKNANFEETAMRKNNGSPNQQSYSTPMIEDDSVFGKVQVGLAQSLDAISSELSAFTEGQVDVSLGGQWFATPASGVTYGFASFDQRGRVQVTPNRVVFPPLTVAQSKDQSDEKAMLEAKRWIDYYSKFGTQHLQAGAHKIPLWQKHDLDIKFMVGLVVLAAFLALRMLLETCFKSKVRVKFQ